MTDKRETVFGLTPFPVCGGYIEYAWDGLSPKMREAVELAKISRSTRQDLPSWWIFSNNRTLTALQRRGLFNQNGRLTEDGKALVEWMKDKERNT